MEIVNIKIYWDLLINTYPRKEIIKYIWRRIKGQFKEFDYPVIYYHKNKNEMATYINCGYLIENCKIASKYFEPNLTKILNNYKSGTFIDCGCHIGKYSLFASNNGMNVIAIDGNSENFLNYNKNIKVVNIIIDKYKGKRKFYINDFYPAQSSVKPVKNSRTIELDCDKLDNICKDYKDIKLIKLDIEDNEFNALVGASQILKKQYPDIIFESLDDDKYFNIRKFLESMGYNSFKLIDTYTYFVTRYKL